MKYSKNTYLFHSRLSIQDLSEKANQPFHYKHYTIIFNGEIYNHQELRKLCNGFNFQTESDTETLLALFEKYNLNMFDLLDGMFAFCILDIKQNKIILGRDRAGKKPLYIYQKNEIIVFSSELNALKTGIQNLDINEDAIDSYLRCGFFYKGYSAYKSISEVDPGHSYTINLSNLKIHKNKYFDILKTYKESKITDFEDALSQVEKSLQKSVKSRLISSDLEVGAFLSGGIDSSLIVARENLLEADNCLFFMCDLKELPFKDKFADLLISVGVLHHLPTPCLDEVRNLEKFAPSLFIYLYYSLENRPFYFRLILNIVTVIRLIISRFRSRLFRKIFSKMTTIIIYIPLIYLSRLFKFVKLNHLVPLDEFYDDKSISRIEQDVYDRFFTRIEQRVSRKDILDLKDTFSSVIISNRKPYWHFICKN